MGKTNNSGESSNSARRWAGVDREIFQERDTIQVPEAPYVFSENNLFVVAGPTGGGKSTLSERLVPLTTDIQFIYKDQTRPQRSVVDSGRNSISGAEFTRRSKRNIYAFEYETRYPDETGNVRRVQYGIPQEELLNKLSIGDCVLTLTDPSSFDALFKTDAFETVTGLANIIPIIVTTESENDLIARLRGRSVDEDERERRLLQVPDQWGFFAKTLQTAPHVIINNTPSTLRQIGFDDTITPEARSDTIMAIDEAVSKFAGIVNFYKHMRKYQPVLSDSDFDIHDVYLNWVSAQHFGTTYRSVQKAIEDGRNIGLKGHKELVDRIKGETRYSAQVDDLFSRLAVVGVSESDNGVVSLRFNDVVETGNTQGGKEIFEKILSQYGFWNKCGTRRFALTDRLAVYDSRSSHYALDMVLVKDKK